jgi:hypothetical protein
MCRPKGEVEMKMRPRGIPFVCALRIRLQVGWV